MIGFQHRPVGLSELLEEPTGRAAHDPFGPRPGGVARTNLASGPGGQVTACVRCGLYLVSQGQDRLALLLRGPEPESRMQTVVLEAVGSRPGLAAAALGEILLLATRHNTFRNQVLSFGSEVFGHGERLMTFHERPSVRAEQVILPAEVLDAVRR